MEIKMGLIAGGKKGKAGKIEVEKGQSVKNGDVLVNVETGKGNRPVKATVDGIITQIRCTEGDEIVSNQVL